MITTNVHPAILKGCLHKRVYATRTAARRAAKLTQRSSGSRWHKCEEYYCGNCGYYHVTSNVRIWNERSSEV